MRDRIRENNDKYEFSDFTNSESYVAALLETSHLVYHYPACFTLLIGKNTAIEFSRRIEFYNIFCGCLNLFDMKNNDIIAIREINQYKAAYNKIYAVFEFHSNGSEDQSITMKFTNRANLLSKILRYQTFGVAKRCPLHEVPHRTQGILNLQQKNTDQA